MLAVTAALSATVALTGCTTTSAGSPMPGGPPSTSDTISTQPASDRPRDIDLTGKDPCAQIPRVDWPKFGIKHLGEPSEHPDFAAPQCYYSGAGIVALLVDTGIEEWTTSKYDAEIEDVEPIDGYRTITVTGNVFKEICWAVVDLADGQSLMVTTSPSPANPNKLAHCDLAYQLAESAMKTLVAGGTR